MKRSFAMISLLSLSLSIPAFVLADNTATGGSATPVQSTPAPKKHSKNVKKHSKSTSSPATTAPTSTPAPATTPAK